MFSFKKSEKKTDKLTIGKLAKVIGAVLPKEIDETQEVARVLTQSEYVKPGDVVISAGWYSHERVIKDSLAKGAAIVFCESKYAEKFDNTRLGIIKDGKDSVLAFEEYCEQGCKAKRIAITGSVGKTTTTGLINAVIANSFNTLTHESMTNSHGGILRTFQRLKPEHEFWVQEVGGVQPGYVESSAKALKPDVAVLTNIGESHADKYGDKQGILKDKKSLEVYAKPDGIVVVNYDDETLRNAEYSHKVVSYALNNKDADYYAENIVTTRAGIEFDIVCKEGRFKAGLNLFGAYNAYNALVAVAVGRWAGIPMPKVIELLKTYYPSGMRQNLMNIGGYTMMIDCFNAEPQTVFGAAETLASLPVEDGGRKIFVTGHIDKIGEASVRMHTELGHRLSKLDVDIMVFFAGDSKYTYEAVVEDGYKNAYLMGSREELEAWMRDNIKKEDITIYKSGQFEAALVKSIDHVYGTKYQNQQQYNEGVVVREGDYSFHLRKDDVIDICGYHGNERELVLPKEYNGVPISRISNRVFTKKRDLVSVEIPDTVVNIGQEAFYVCPSISKLYLPSSLKFIDKNAFNYCKGLKEVILPESTLHLDRHAFYECTNLEKIYIPESVGFIGEDAFGKCPKVTIVCKAGSHAETYAKENGHKYIAE